jgi:hypothetical protein
VEKGWTPVETDEKNLLLISENSFLRGDPNNQGKWNGFAHYLNKKSCQDSYTTILKQLSLLWII